MKYEFYSVSINGISMGIWPGSTEGEALDSLAKDGGYSDYADMRERTDHVPCSHCPEVVTVGLTAKEAEDVEALLAQGYSEWEAVDDVVKAR